MVLGCQLHWEGVSGLSLEIYSPFSSIWTESLQRQSGAPLEWITTHIHKAFRSWKTQGALLLWWMIYAMNWTLSVMPWPRWASSWESNLSSDHQPFHTWHLWIVSHFRHGNTLCVLYRPLVFGWRVVYSMNEWMNKVGCHFPKTKGWITGKYFVFELCPPETFIPIFAYYFPLSLLWLTHILSKLEGLQMQLTCGHRNSYNEIGKWFHVVQWGLILAATEEWIELETKI